MSLDDIGLDGAEVGSNSQEGVKEKSEKQSEASKKAQAQLQKTQKDEKKAKQDNVDLFALLSRFIQNPLYSELIPSIIDLLQLNYPSRFILAIISMIYPEASQYLFRHIGKEIQSSTYTNIHKYESVHTFHDTELHSTIREWITLWMTNSQVYLTSKDASLILTKKTLNLLTGDEKKTAITTISLFFRTFLLTKNVAIDIKKSNTYAEFIISEYQKCLEIFLSQGDASLLESRDISSSDLFGIGDKLAP